MAQGAFVPFLAPLFFLRASDLPLPEPNLFAPSVLQTLSIVMEALVACKMETSLRMEIVLADLYRTEAIPMMEDTLPNSVRWTSMRVPVMMQYC